MSTSPSPPRRFAVARSALTLFLPLVILVSACSSDDGSAEESADAAVVLSRAGSATRSSSPFGFVQLLRTELSDGKSLQQRTVGVYDGVNDRASIEVTSEGDTEGVFTASTTIDLGSKLSIVIDGEEVFLKVEFLGIDDDAGWSPVPPGPNTPNAEGVIAILGAGLVADLDDVEVVGTVEVNGRETTHYRTNVFSADAAIYLPTQTLDAFVDAGMSRATVDARTTIEYWIDSEGRIVRMSIDHLPLFQSVDGLVAPGLELVSAVQTIDITEFGTGSIERPSDDDITSE